MKSDFIQFNGQIVKRDAILYIGLNGQKITITFNNNSTLSHTFKHPSVAFEAMQGLSVMLTTKPYVPERLGFEK